jgi:hypothetical protein
MKRTLLLATALGVFLGFAQPARPAQAAVSVGFSIGSGGRHDGFSLSFRSRPDVVLIPSSSVYYAQDANEDVYFYDDAWYCVEDGVWYMADSYQGPFVAIGFSSVPYEIRNVPGSYRRHWEGYTAPAQTYGDGFQNRGWNQDRGDAYQNRGSNQTRGGWNQDRGGAYQNRSSNQDRGGWSQNRVDTQQNRGHGNQGGNWNNRDNSGDRGNHGRGNGANGDRGNRGRGNSNRGGRGWGR